MDSEFNKTASKTYFLGLTRFRNLKAESFTNNVIEQLEKICKFAFHLV